MKKLFLFAIMCLSAIVVWAQNVPRQMVVLEITTSTLCTYCPGAAMGAEDLLNNGKLVAVIEHHNNWQGASDPFITSASQARSVTLAPGGNPGAFFDVKSKVIGGSHTQSMYPQYLAKYNLRIVKTSPLIMTMDVTNTGLDYTVVITMTKVGTITSTNLRMMFVVTQSHIAYNWQGQNTINYANRLMLPNASGTVVDFSSGDTQTVTMNFSLNASWPIEDCEIIAYLEDMTGNEVLNGMKRAVVDLQPEFSASETSVLINQPVTFTNATTGGYIDALETYRWLFPGATPDTSIEKNPTVSYADSGTYDVTLIVNRGGQIDTLTKTTYIHSSYPVGIQEKSSNLSASILPNPNNGKFVLELNSSKAITTDLKIMNTLGSTIYEESNLTINGKVVKTLNLNLNSGIYFLVLQNGDKKVIQKLFVN